MEVQSAYIYPTGNEAWTCAVRSFVLPGAKTPRKKYKIYMEGGLHNRSECLGNEIAQQRTSRREETFAEFNILKLALNSATLHCGSMRRSGRLSTDLKGGVVA